MRRGKYGARKTEIDGITFASAKEARRYAELKIEERAGLIRNLELQPVYEIAINGVRVCKYVGDFRYFRDQDRVLEDVKGQKTPMYRLKRKLVEAAYPGTKIIEI